MLSLAIITLTPAALQFMQRGDAAPARRAAGLAVLEEHIAHRQGHDAEPRARDGVDCPSPFVVLLQRERAAVADQDAARKAALDRHVGDDLERASGRIGAFVDVEVELPALALRELEEDAERLRRRSGTMRVTAPRIPVPWASSIASMSAMWAASAQIRW